MILTNASGTFAGLPQGATLIAPGGLRFRISYTAGDGNDVTLTVEGPPSIGPLDRSRAIENQPIAPIDFTVTDDFTAPAALIVTVSSSNTALVADGHLALTGTGTTRTLTITPEPGATGTSTITVTASDGVLSSQRSFELTVTPLLRYVLSEGATGDFFDTDILIANPHAASTPVNITFTTQAGAVITQDRTLLPMSQTQNQARRDRRTGSDERLHHGDLPAGRPDRRRAHDAMGCDGLRRARGKGVAGRGRGMVFRRRLAGILLHVPAARESARHRQHRARDVAARRRGAARARLPDGPVVAPHRPRG